MAERADKHEAIRAPYSPRNNPDGTVAHKKFNKKIISENEWRYENIGAHAGETDRCYNGGTIINYKVPKTGDRADLRLWLGCVLLGVSAVCGTLVFILKPDENNPSENTNLTRKGCERGRSLSEPEREPERA
ncbi:MAG: hypothetical protein IJ214_12155, partial [Clostridia bacterium]|nr:hypothetical protein [Clostridia bacterium]